MKPAWKKRYGQHFLRDTGIIRRIVGLIAPGPSDLVVEIGAGAGALSIHLAPNVLRLIAIEVDRDIIPELVQALEPYPNAEVVGKDILKMDVAELLGPCLGEGMRLRIVGNLPYNIGTAIIETLILQAIPAEDMIFMLQLETAERIAATPGSKEYGFFSVFCRHHCDVRLGFTVPPACFVPRPKVYSQMITLRPRRAARDPLLEECFLEITKAAFAYRRKKLANSLCQNRRIGPVVDILLFRAGIDGARRAGDLAVEEYESLSIVYRELALERIQVPASEPRA